MGVCKRVIRIKSRIETGAIVTGFTIASGLCTLHLTKIWLQMDPNKLHLSSHGINSLGIRHAMPLLVLY